MGKSKPLTNKTTHPPATKVVFIGDSLSSFCVWTISFTCEFYLLHIFPFIAFGTQGLLCNM